MFERYENWIINVKVFVPVYKVLVSACKVSVLKLYEMEDVRAKILLKM